MNHTLCYQSNGNSAPSHNGTKANAQLEEEAHFRNIINAFCAYESYSLSANNIRRKHLYSLPKSQRDLIPDYASRLSQVDDAISHNAQVLKTIVVDADMFGIPMPSPNAPIERPMDHDMDKLRSTMKQFVRDWSKLGSEERKLTYDPIIDELNEYFQDLNPENRNQGRVLVPGAGLGRLAFDIAKAGYSCQGNEFSFYMLLCSHFILNRVQEEEQFKLFPFIHSFSNVRSKELLLHAVSIPDTLPRGLPPGADFSMVAGDFLEVYGHGTESEGKWDAVVTCFFIDTAKNVVDYIQTIYASLKPGGLWINVGPLLYHYENMPGEISIELTLEEVKQVTRNVGFEIVSEMSIKSTYTANPNGMLQYVYDCAYWSALKPE